LTPKKEDQDRRHQRATANTGQADDDPDEKTGQDECEIRHGGDCSGLICHSKRFFRC